MRRTARYAGLAAALALGGCSFVAVRHPPSSPPPGAPLECTQSRVAPGFDTAGAILAPLVGLGAYGSCAFLQTQQSWASDPKDLSCGAILGATIGVTAAYTASAIYGFHGTGECRRLAERSAPPEDAAPARPLPAHLAPAPPR